VKNLRNYWENLLTLFLHLEDQSLFIKKKKNWLSRQNYFIKCTDYIISRFFNPPTTFNEEESRLNFEIGLRFIIAYPIYFVFDMANIYSLAHKLIRYKEQYGREHINVEKIILGLYSEYRCTFSNPDKILLGYKTFSYVPEQELFEKVMDFKLTSENLTITNIYEEEILKLALALAATQSFINPNKHVIRLINWVIALNVMDPTTSPKITDFLKSSIGSVYRGTSNTDPSYILRIIKDLREGNYITFGYPLESRIRLSNITEPYVRICKEAAFNLVISYAPAFAKKPAEEATFYLWSNEFVKELDTFAGMVDCPDIVKIALTTIIEIY